MVVSGRVIRLPLVIRLFHIGTELLIHQVVGQHNSLIQRLGRLHISINVIGKSTDVLVDLLSLTSTELGTYQAVAVSDEPGDGSRVHTHDHDGSAAPDESLDSILSSEPKPLGKHRPLNIKLVNS
ncbi:hypothetical protein Tco_0344616 [Tanacetum coccineum]